MKRLIPFLMLTCLFAFSASAVQPNENKPCCELKLRVDSPMYCLTEADLIGKNWVEKFDASIASTHRILAFNHYGQLDINTIFEGGYEEAEVGTWKLSYQNGQSYLVIDDPVIGEQITYEVTATCNSIQLKEKGIDEVLEFTVAPDALKASF